MNRNTIQKRLEEIKVDVYEMVENNAITEGKTSDLMARLRYVRMEWMILKKYCNDPFHNEEVCPECGIELFEAIFDLDL